MNYADKAYRVKNKCTMTKIARTQTQLHVVQQETDKTRRYKHLVALKYIIYIFFLCVWVGVNI